MKKITLFAAALLLSSGLITLLSCKSSGPAAGGTALTFNLQKGNGYKYEMVWDMNQGLGASSTKIGVIAAYNIVVTEETDSVKTLQFTYDDFQMNMSMGGKEMNIDAKKPAPPVTPEQIKEDPSLLMGRMFNGIIHKKFYIKVDRHGGLLEVTGFQDIINGMIDSTGLGAEYTEVMRSTLDKQFNAESTKSQFGQFFSIFPDKKVNIGDSWEKDLDFNGMKSATTYTLKSIEGSSATLDTKTTFTNPGSGATVSGDQTGTLIVDTKTGLVVNASFDQHITTESAGRQVTITGKGKIKGTAL